ncbi:MAG: glycoside hydrolase family 3 C-terminal domain-containing protein [Bacilli bacterium]
MKKSQKRKIIGCSSLGVIGVALIAFNVGLGTNFSNVAQSLGTTTVTGNYTSADCFNDGVKANTEIEEEGAALLVNKDNLLPLTNQKVTILGACSHNYVQGGTGSAGGKDDQNTVMLDTVMENANIDYNKTAWEWLDNALGLGQDSHNATVNKDYLAEADKEVVSKYDWTDYKTIHEFSQDTYNQFVTDTVIGSYKDVAIVTFGRSGAEGASPSLEYDGNKDTTTGRDYLELSDEEKDLLKFCKSKFSHTIVLINSALPMECGFVNNDDYNVDGVLWIGLPGEAGINAVGEILNGNVNPSGHLVDTWTYDMTTNPTFYSANDQTYSNVSGNGIGSKNKYYEYNEGIYVGYRYYKTADAAGYFDSTDFKNTKFKGHIGEGKYYSELSETNTYESMKAEGPKATYAGYDELVQFPFGYGLSYTSFKQEITSKDIKLEKHGENTISVKVTNTGKAAGKSVVQIYMESPYNQDTTLGITGVGLEKAKMELVGFAKTDELAQGESQSVEVSFSTDELASYDEFGKGRYVLEKGDYTFHVAQNAHSWNADDADIYGGDYATTTTNVADTKIYDDKRVITMNGVTVEEGTVAKNIMADITAGDGAMLVNGGSSGSYKLGYLSRKDFASGLKEIMSYQSDDDTGKYSGNGYVWSADGKGTTPLANGGVTENGSVRRKAAQAVVDAIVTTPAQLTVDGVNNGMDYNYGSLVADGITLPDGQTTKKLYGYGNDAAVNSALTRDGKSADDASYLKSDAGNEIKFDATYYVAENNGELVKAEDGYVAIFDTQADANGRGTARKLMAADMAGVPDDDLDRWDKLANELSFNEADDLMGINSWQEMGLPNQLANLIS